MGEVADNADNALLACSRGYYRRDTRGNGRISCLKPHFSLYMDASDGDDANSGGGGVGDVADDGDDGGKRSRRAYVAYSYYRWGAGAGAAGREDIVPK